jgi:multiple sugar transport system substrate-binding protein
MKRVILVIICFIILSSTGCQSSDKNVISISVPFSNDYLRKAIKLFEKRYDDIHIQLNEYEGDMTDNNSVEKYIASMSSEIMSGNGADIIYITGLPYKNYIEKGVLEDLYGYISSSSPGMDIFQENILNACIDNGKIFFLPINFSYPVLFVKNDIVANIDDTSWDWSGFLHVSNSITAKESGLHAIANLSGSELISYMLGGDYTSFVNYQTKESNFLSDEFAELTEFCNATIQNEKIIYSGTDVEDAVKRGTIVFSYYNLYSFSDLASIMSNYGTDRSVLKLPMSISNKGNRFFPMNYLQ